MFLRTLGELSLEGCDFRRAKPLLLAAYLTIEGPAARRYLAEIFWPGASDAMNSLSVALSQLRRGASGSIEADENRAWSNIDSDATTLRRNFTAGRVDETVAGYTGPFLEGFDLELGEELEEWVYRTRESLASLVRESLLRQAEQRAGQGRYDESRSLVERAYRLPGSAPVQPEEFVRFHLLLVAARSPLASDLRDEAEGYGIELRVGEEEARARLGRRLLGRERELERLASLAPGEWVWVRGDAGMGKTVLLRQLPGTYLPGRSGLPYATLEPLLGESLGESEASLLRRLATVGGQWIIDDWELVDEESRSLLGRLRSLRPEATVVIAAAGQPELPVDDELVLGPLPAGTLDSYPQAWEQTGGLPELVGAMLRDEPLQVVMERRLARLGESERETYLALALLEEPDPVLVRKSLGLSSREMAGALDRLLEAGLVEPSGAVRARQAALAYLDWRPARAGPLALRIARGLRGTAAFPFYRRARAFWEPEDEPEAAQSYLAWGEELLRRGFARRAAALMSEAPGSPQGVLLLARALEHCGDYKQALDRLAEVRDEPQVFALRSALLWRLGRPDEARAAAELALEGDSEARAEALNTLGVLARSGADYSEAASYARRAAALWRTLGNRMRWVSALNNLGIARTLSGESGESAFAEALEAAQDSSLLRARTLLNLGWAHEQEGQLEWAEGAYRQAVELAAEAGVTEVAAWAWNNRGVLRHKQGSNDSAREAYENALALAQQAGEQRILGMVMANLAELQADREAWEEALRILEKSGHEVLVRNLLESLEPGHAFLEPVA